MASGTPGGGRGGGPEREPDRFADLPPVDIAIPDDLSELDEEVRAYRREHGARDRPGGVRNTTGKWQLVRRSGPVGLVFLLVLALVGAMASLMAPSRQSRPPPATPLATRVTGAPGQAGALLPAGRVRVDGVPVDLRSVRPAVFALVTPGCGCDKELDQLFSTAVQYRLDMLLVPTSTHDTAEFRKLVARVGLGSVRVTEDLDAALRTAYAPRGLTVVLVRADGVVTAVHRGLRELRRLELDLARLAHPEIAR